MFYSTQSSNLVPQILPNFCIQRSLYERRERPAKTYSWKVFILSNILVELPWNTLMSFILFVSWYYPIGLYRNAEASHAVVERGVTMFLLMWVYMVSNRGLTCFYSRIFQGLFCISKTCFAPGVQCQSCTRCCFNLGTPGKNNC